MKLPIELTVSPGFYIYAAVLLLLLPFPWLLGFLLAGLLHESGHLLVLRLMKIPVHSVHLEPTGAMIVSGPLSNRQELAAAAAGPAVGLLIAILFPWFPALGLCAIAQTAFNLLPILPFDGGRILRCIAASFFGQGRAQTVCSLSSAVTAVVFGFGAVCLLRYSLFASVVCVLVLLQCVKNRKNLT